MNCCGCSRPFLAITSHSQFGPRPLLAEPDKTAGSERGSQDRPPLVTDRQAARGAPSLAGVAGKGRRVRRVLYPSSGQDEAVRARNGGLWNNWSGIAVITPV
jgi:hypothetical protein